jgi:hypothetical protein
MNVLCSLVDIRPSEKRMNERETEKEMWIK